MYRLKIKARSLTPFGCKKFIARRVVCYTDDKLALVLQSDGHAKTWIAVSEIRCAVERVNDPFPSRIAVDNNSVTGLFRKDHMARVVRFDPLDDQSFRRKIGFRNQVIIAFFCDSGDASVFFE